MSDKLVLDPTTDEVAKQPSDKKLEGQTTSGIHPLLDALLFWISRTFQTEEREVARYVKDRHPKGFRAKDSVWTVFHGMHDAVTASLAPRMNESFEAYDAWNRRKRFWRGVALFSVGFVAGVILAILEVF